MSVAVEGGVEVGVAVSVAVGVSVGVAGLSVGIELVSDGVSWSVPFVEVLSHPARTAVVLPRSRRNWRRD
ncbi:hypothetical protein [Halapricum hydrolyticum]|uniref:Uncharacterized protein n=1 Tax=Halapricum hydrolyticum TaxID=2979991 RepID=A0AAE3I8V8_9EURY|nr:hypothetical protein [Halapricum hydrolyticum]MCU4716465.1 hypothetical protein [Halapricum hydrolyticum]MCU4725931.1 hypothetical protein [Halapricum hydrolyticum]